MGDVEVKNISPTKARVIIDVESGLGFKVIPAVIGPKGQFMRYIFENTGCRTCVKGKGATYGQMSEDEAAEKLHIEVIHRDEKKLQQGIKLAVELVLTVRQQHKQHLEEQTSGKTGGYRVRLTGDQYAAWMQYYQDYYRAYAQFIRYTQQQKAKKITEQASK
ncbi:hypothetical protein J8273_6374 [Carpediemonas membranifera]|uniref:KHDC4/BBP-like KH-domain type I domain-containing protein n=1 Tax=Carpediemonas membranifera TaxID=201153 RepID=A0A8J6B0G2_9EUKA|nr:hypothetical protein J8273_6374 [Carpediemonas membranifera]|eukprot:KAG9391609.1 hypothetical protein J8273_6374 [Carpediemonas membranifera]